MEKLRLPKLKFTPQNLIEKKKILLLSDDLRSFSGIGNMSREIVLNTVSKYDWVQLGSAVKHPEMGKVVDISPDVRKTTGVIDANVKIYPMTGYGNDIVLREMLNREAPDAIVHFTDPRYWEWLYSIEHEIRQFIPIFYYNIWDSPPAPLWNKSAYLSCDLIMNISKQTHGLVKETLDGHFTELLNIDDKKDKIIFPIVSYVPHGINKNFFFKVNDDDQQMKDFKKKVFGDKNFEYIILFNSRNIRRKSPGDLILAYKMFCDLDDVNKEKCVLVMNTSPQDQNGTDLFAVKEAICPDEHIYFTQNLPLEQLNLLYNLADVTVMISSNEGFGLSTAESLSVGTPIIVNVTGGLQDQCGFKGNDGKLLTELDYSGDWPSNHTKKYTEHGDWVYPVWPSNRSLQGSIPTPYIFDDRCSFEDVSKGIYYWYLKGRETRKELGFKGYEYLNDPKIKMTAKMMGEGFIKSMEKTFEVWKPRKRFSIYKVSTPKKRKPLKFIY